MSRSCPIPDESLSVAEKHDLTFDVVSDVGANVARKYGWSFDNPAELAALLREPWLSHVS